MEGGSEWVREGWRGREWVGEGGSEWGEWERDGARERGGEWLSEGGMEKEGGEGGW